MCKLMVVLIRFLPLCAVLLVFPAVAAAQPPPLAPGWYRNSGPSVIYEDSSGLRIPWENSYVYPYPGDVPLYWYAEVVYVNNGSQALPLFCMDEATNVKEHIRGDQGIPPDGDGYVPAEEGFCTRNPGWTGSIEPGGAFYEWVIFHNVPSEGEVSLEWGPFGFSPWVDPWYSPLANIPPPAECPPELVTLGTCVEGIVRENHIKRLVDLVSDVVSGSKAACDIRGCESLQFPVDLLNNIFTVFNLGAAAVQEVIFGDKLKALNQAIREHGRDSPQARQAAEEVYQATRNLHRTLISLVPPLGFIFPLPVE